jgi:carbonic anhydrase
MTCNVPLNIVRQQTDRCNLKCKLWYNYGNSSCLVSKKKDKISITYDGQSDVMFNSVPYKPTEIRIFKPSIHSYDGEFAEGELIIVHTGGQRGLAICIPITASETMKSSKGSTILQEIIKNTPNNSAALNINISDFNANHLIPKASYFSYVGGLIGGDATTGFTCSNSPGSEVQYVVFHKSHGSITLNNRTLDTLGTIIQDSFIPFYEGKSFFNEKGTTENGFSGDGQIYIDCQPTDEDSELIYETPINKKDYDWIWPYFLIILGILIAFLGYRLFSSSFKNFGSFGNNLKGLYETKSCPVPEKD